MDLNGAISLIPLTLPTTWFGRESLLPHVKNDFLLFFFIIALVEIFCIVLLIVFRLLVSSYS